MINSVILTGYLPGDATARCSPGGQRRLDFELRTTDSQGAESVQRLYIDDTGMMGRMERRLIAGAAVIVQGELTSRPYEQQGVVKSYVREIRATRIDVTGKGAE